MPLEAYLSKDDATKIPLRCCLDEILGGGIETRMITQVYGPAGSGKTNFCLQAAINCVTAGKKVIFIDTDGGRSVDRTKQMAGEDFKKVLENSYFYEPVNFDDQDIIIEKLAEFVDEKFGLIVLDSAVSLYRVHDDEEARVGKHDRLYAQMIKLRNIAKKNNLAVIVTSHVYSSENGNIMPYAWMSLSYMSKAVIELRKDGTNTREAVLKRHRSMPEDACVKFVIENEGIKEECSGRDLNPCRGSESPA
jgi:DNA repair protein RadB